jgi:hypothetical protein
MTRHSQEVWGDCTRDPRVVERKGDQVRWFGEQICDNGKELVTLKRVSKRFNWKKLKDWRVDLYTLYKIQIFKWIIYVLISIMTLTNYLTHSAITKENFIMKKKTLRLFSHVWFLFIRGQKGTKNPLFLESKVLEERIRIFPT